MNPAEGVLCGALPWLNDPMTRWHDGPIRRGPFPVSRNPALLHSNLMNPGLRMLCGSNLRFAATTVGHISPKWPFHAAWSKLIQPER
jgi:hypothetical protein